MGSRPIVVFLLVLVGLFVAWSFLGSTGDKVRTVRDTHPLGGGLPPARVPPAVPVHGPGLFDFPFEDKVIDVNIGTNFDPMPHRADRFLVLVDPLYEVCARLATTSALEPETIVYCMAVSNQTGFAKFHEYWNKGVSSSLAKTGKGTTHEQFPVKSIRHVFVAEALAFFYGMVGDGRNRIDCLKMDMQGYELTVLQNLVPLLRASTNSVARIRAECFCPRDGKQIYEVDNACERIDALLTRLGYTTSQHYQTHCGPASKKEYSDIDAFRAPATSHGSEVGCWA